MATPVVLELSVVLGAEEGGELVLLDAPLLFPPELFVLFDPSLPILAPFESLLCDDCLGCLSGVLWGGLGLVSVEGLLALLSLAGVEADVVVVLLGVFRFCATCS